MPALLFYKNPAPLNRDRHKKMKFKSSDNYNFTDDVNSVPLTGIEFFEASRDIPVLFSKDEEGRYSPLALLSLMEKGHRQINEHGNWDESYVPAFVRRYPFAMTDDGTVCFDEASGRFNQKSGERLFDEKGENTETLNTIIQFLNSYNLQYKNTQKYCDACAELELFTPFNVHVQIEKNKPLRLEGLHVLDEKKLAEIPDEKLQQWFRLGWLAWSYAHLHSLGALNRLLKRQEQAG